MNEKPDKNTMEEIAIVMSIEPAYVEKDWYVTQVIALLSEMKYEGFELVFTGGTSLAKAHHLIKRFSEDIDFRVIAPESLQTRKILSNFKKFLIKQLNNVGFTIPEDKIHSRNENQFFSISIDYETYFDRKSSLRPHIQLEINVRAPQLPACYSSVSSFVNELSKKLPEVNKVACTNPVENAADKLSAITWRIPDRIRDGIYDDPSIVRHIHDLAILGDIALADPQFCTLLHKSMQSDNSRSKNNLSFSNQTLKEKFSHMLRILDIDKEYQKEYTHFVESMSYASSNSIPSFKSAIKAVEQLVNKATNLHFD